MNVLLYTGCFMFQATLLLLALIYSRLFWVLKAGLIMLSLGFSAAFYQAVVNSLGYPVATTPSGEFEYLSSMVREPRPANDDPGAVYVWVVEDGHMIPRAIVMPYSVDLRKQVTIAKKMVQNGRVFMGLKQSGSDKEPQGGNSKPSNSMQHGRSDNKVPYDVQEVPTLEFKPPPDTVPRKN